MNDEQTIAEKINAALESESGKKLLEALNEIADRRNDADQGRRSPGMN